MGGLLACLLAYLLNFVLRICIKGMEMKNNAFHSIH